jgi:hypothetical protein
MADTEDIKNAERLVTYGFHKKGDWKKDIKEREKQVREKGGEKILKDGEVDIETMEFRNGEFIKTSYPNPRLRNVLALSDPNYAKLEKSYLWILNHVTLDFGFTKSMKITDTYGSSVGTDHWGVMNDRIKGTQQTISTTMQTIGALVKDMFPMIHELTLLDERLKWHEEADKGVKAGDTALKGVWTDLVDGGPENNGSVFGLARNAGFVTLPDLFFAIYVQKPEDIDKEVDSMEHGNTQIKSVLRRKLLQYLTWKEHTYREILNKKRFTVRYLRQHIAAINLNMNWLTPYLRQMKYLKMNTNFQDNPTLISSFDTAKFEIETLCTKKNDNKYKPIVLLNFQYLSFPERSGPTYQYSGFQHAGAMTVTFRGYVWTEEQIENYKRMRSEEGMDLLGEMDGGFKAAMDELAKEIRKYIEEAEGELPQTPDEKMIHELEEKLQKYEEEAKDPAAKKKKQQNNSSAGAIYEPFVEVGKAFWEVGKIFVPKKYLISKCQIKKNMHNNKKIIKKSTKRWEL